MGEKVTAYLYFLNGWQQIRDFNSQKSFGSQLEIRPNERLLINWNTYIGDERSEFSPDFRTRYFSDVYVIFTPSEKFQGSVCAYYGIQEQERVLDGDLYTSDWFTVNLIGKYNFTEKLGLSGRLEYFEDLESVQITPTTPIAGFSSYSATLGLNYQVSSNALVRLESRSFFSGKDVYQSDEDQPTSSNQWVVGNITVWF
ncbi:MAG: outer membrane beta-barrel protein [Bacteroidia bacterium]|nr:outer membrane beta-barrel protein [Bacteroidia bacterium]